MSASLIVTMKLLTLNLLLIIVLALKPFYMSQMLIQTIDMSDLDKTLMTLNFEAKIMLLKMWLALRIFLTLSDVIWELINLDTKGMPTIFR